MTSYMICADDYNAVDVLPRYDSGMVRAGGTWAYGPGWVPVEMPELLCGSDYMGGDITESNYRVFKDRYGNIPGVREFSGGYGGYGILLTPWAMAWITEPVGPELADISRAEHVRDIVRGLEERYCSLDDDELALVDTEREDSARESSYRREFVNRLQDRHFAGASRLADMSTWTDSDGNVRPWDAAYELCREAMDASNTYWEHETGSSVYLDVERVVAAVTPGMVGKVLASLPDASTGPGEAL